MSFVMSHEALGFPGISGSGFQSRITTERETDSGATLLKGAVQESSEGNSCSATVYCTDRSLRSRVFALVISLVRVYCDIDYLLYTYRLKTPGSGLSPRGGTGL